MERTKLVFSGQGTFSTVPGRFEGGYEAPTRPIEAYYGSVRTDAVLYGSIPTSETVLGVFGADHVGFATDYSCGGHGGEDCMASAF